MHEYDLAIKADPEFAEAFFCRGQVFAKQKQFDKAIEDYSASIKYAPDNGRVYYARSVAFHSIGKIDQANKDLLESKRLGFQKSVPAATLPLHKQ